MGIYKDAYRRPTGSGEIATVTAPMSWLEKPIWRGYVTCLGHSPGAKLELDPARLPYSKIRFVVSLTLWVPNVHAPSAYRRVTISR